MAATTRKNDTALRFLGAAALAVATWAALRQMPFYPGWLQLLLAAGAGAIALYWPANASLAVVGVLSLPVIAGDFVVGLFLLIGGLIATQYLSTGRAGAFILAVIGVAALPLHAAWAVVAVAGYVLGRARGAAAGAAVAVTATAIGIVAGLPALGVLATGGESGAALVSLSTPPADALAFGWVVPGLQAADPVSLFTALGGIRNLPLVLGQVALWATAGAVGSFVAKAKPAAVLAATAGAIAGLALGQVALGSALSSPVGSAEYLASLAVSLPIALGMCAAAIWIFPAVRTGPRVAEQSRERDVDELLSVIASAEDELAARHNTEAVVLITDMKSFSAMTEALGSVGSAKVVQRHRDLLLPIIRLHKGSGSPTGGDGLVACFRSPADAVAAAIAMQQALEGYTGSDRSPHELSVRVGIASGEVVVDSNGVPFLGAALNMAARVMDVADGGRIMITSYIASTAGLDSARIHRHGEFKLKNIAEPIPVAEVLWRDGLTPQEIRAS